MRAQLIGNTCNVVDVAAHNDMLVNTVVYNYAAVLLTSVASACFNCMCLSIVVTDLYADSVARISALCLITYVAYLIAAGYFNCRCKCRLWDLFVEFSADLQLSNVDVM